MKPFVLLAILCAASAVHAQGMTSTLGNGGSLTMSSKLWLHENNNSDLALPQDAVNSPRLYFNYAACVCAQPGISQITPWNQGQFSLEIDATPDITSVQYPLQIWVGSMCDSFGDPTVIQQNCHQVTPTNGLPPTIASIQVSQFIRPELSVFDLMVPEPAEQATYAGTGTCPQRVIAPSEYGIADINPPDGMDDFSISNPINTDSQPPPIPTVFQGGGSQNGVHLTWTAPTGNVPDIAYYQALCAGPDGTPALTSPAASPRYVTPRTLCGAPQDVALVTSSVSGVAPPDAGIPTADAGITDGGIPGLPTGLAQLDPSFICADQPTATATSIDIGGLQNGVPYTVVLLAIDLSGNAAGTAFTTTFTPQPVTDFWDDIHDRGSDVQGGFCLIADTYGNDSFLTRTLRNFRDDTLEGSGFGRWLVDVYYAHVAPLGESVQRHVVLRVIAAILLVPIVGFALLWHTLTLPGTLVLIALLVLHRRLRRRIGRRRLARHRRLLVNAGVAAACLLVPRFAHAQSPYWDSQSSDSDDGSGPAADLPSLVHWNAGFRIGPYVPQIDSKLGLTPGPFQQMFGSDSSWMPMLDVDRVLLSGEWGQLLVGGTIGYMSKSAHPFTFGSDPNDPDRPRAPNDTSAFHLIPFAITASYRFTMLDDNYAIPIVPYVRGGLSYYAWWFTTDGNFSDVMGDKARGASLGLQGTIGIAIRAERIDADAARSMQDSGIYHAGFFAELQAADVDGFGSSSKLSVGDNTWFAGFNFEF